MVHFQAFFILILVLFGSTALVASASVSIDDQEEGWQTKHVVGRFFNTEPPQEDGIFKFQYRVINGTVDEFKIVRGTDPVTLGQRFDIKVSSTTDNAVFEIMVPRNFPYTNYPPENPSGIDNFEFFPKGDGTIEYDRVTTDCFFVFSVPVINSTEMSLGMSIIPTRAPYHGDEISNECIPETVVEDVSTKPNGTIRPSHQVSVGVAPEEVICPSGLELILNPKGIPYCATPSSAEMLKERWMRTGIAEAERTTVRVDIGGVPNQERIQSGMGTSLMTTYLPVNITQTINLLHPVDKLIIYPIHADWDGVIRGGKGGAMLVDENNNPIAFECFGTLSLRGVLATCTEPYFVEVKESDLGEDGIKLEQTMMPVTSRIYWGDTFHIYFSKPQSGTIGYTIGGYGIVPEDYNNKNNSTYRTNGAGNQDVSELYHLSFVSFYPATVTVPEQAEIDSLTEIICAISRESTDVSVSSFSRIFVYDVWFRFE